MTKLPKILTDELIGVEVEITNATHKDHIGLKGRVRDETKNTLIIGDKMIPKASATFRFSFPDESVEIEGSKLRHRPEDRLKKMVRI